MQKVVFELLRYLFLQANPEDLSNLFKHLTQDNVRRLNYKI